MTEHDLHRVAHKVLSANDIGLTGSHQAGIHVPKTLARSGFFPELDEHLRNPREELRVRLSTGREVRVPFIYYNNRRFGGTRDEFRLTHLTQPLREIGASPEGLLQITRIDDDLYRMEMLGKDMTAVEGNAVGRKVLRLGGGWVLINI